ncbi:MAG: BCCT family transporter, partial [Halioglobus sp.]
MSTSTSMDLIDRPTFFGSLFLLLLVTVPLIVFPEQGAAWVLSARNFLTGELGVLYLALGVGAFGFMVFICLSDIGSIL